MADVHSKEVRSYNMSQIKNKDTKPELLVRKYLFANGFRFKLHDKRLPGKPDIVLPKYKTVILVNGCFWHGHKGCSYFILPKTRRNWWREKIENTVQRDKKQIQELKKLGWNVITLFECKIHSGWADRFLLKFIIK
jgi:DNA mismatch endonuclease (patch repair protein)